MKPLSFSGIDWISRELRRFRVANPNKMTTNTGYSMQGRTIIPAVTKQFRGYASDAKASPTEVSSILEQRIRGVSEEASLAETGRVLSVGYEAPAVKPKINQTAD